MARATTRRPVSRPRRPATEGGPRVLLVCGDLRPGLDGVADYAVRLTGALTAAGAIVRVLHTGPPSGVPGARSVGSRWRIGALLAAGRRARSADVVHVQLAPSMYGFRAGIGLLPLLLGRTPLVVTLHEYGWWRWERRLPAVLWTLLERLRLADRETVLLVPRAREVVVTNARHAADVAHRFAGRISTVTIPIGANVDAPTDLERADRGVRREVGAAPGAVLVAFFGFVHPVKGVRYLAAAVAALAAEGRDLHLLVIGGFESLALPAAEAVAFEAELRQQIDAAGATDRTTITGFLDPAAVSRLLAASDVAALPFTAGVTGKSGSLLTALAHGLPTVVTAPPGGADGDLVDGEQVAVVAAVRDPSALAAGLQRVLDDPVLAGRIAATGRSWAAERDWSRIAERHLQRYAEARR